MLNNNLSIASHKIRQFDGLFSLNDLHGASGSKARNKPSNFLRVDQTQALIEEIERCSDMSIDRVTNSQLAIKVKRGGHDQGTYGCKEIVYAYAMWISPKFMLKVIRAYDEMYGLREGATISKHQEQEIQEAVYALIDKTGEPYQSIYTRFRDKFGLENSFKELKASDFDQAIEFLRKPVTIEDDKEASRVFALALMKLGADKHGEVSRAYRYLVEKLNDLANQTREVSRMINHIEVSDGIIHDGLVEAQLYLSLDKDTHRKAREKAQSMFTPLKF